MAKNGGGSLCKLPATRLLAACGLPPACPLSWPSRGRMGWGGVMSGGALHCPALFLPML